jgi:two-component system chemotaxis response regulator CheB
MPVTFTSAYARRLDGQCAVRVREAAHGDRVTAGTVLIAPGDTHLTVVPTSGGVAAALVRSPEVNRHRPSVDVLMSSVARTFGPRALAVIMTGMGKDGARGIAEIRRSGGYILAQDEASSVIYGMNREVIENGDHHEVVSLRAIAARLIDLTRPPLRERDQR